MPGGPGKSTAGGVVDRARVDGERGEAGRGRLIRSAAGEVVAGDLVRSGPREAAPAAARVVDVAAVEHRRVHRVVAAEAGADLRDRRRLPRREPLDEDRADAHGVVALREPAHRDPVGVDVDRHRPGLVALDPERAAGQGPAARPAGRPAQRRLTIAGAGSPSNRHARAPAARHERHVGRDAGQQRVLLRARAEAQLAHAAARSRPAGIARRTASTWRPYVPVRVLAEVGVERQRPGGHGDARHDGRATPSSARNRRRTPVVGAPDHPTALRAHPQCTLLRSSGGAVPTAGQGDSAIRTSPAAARREYGERQQRDARARSDTRTSVPRRAGRRIRAATDRGSS